MERTSIKLNRVALESFLEDYSGKYPTTMKLVNIRGCNGAGKSTVPLQLLAKDRGAFIFTLNGKDVATCFPSYGFVAMGKYRSKTGGVDGINSKQEKQELLGILWKTPFSIIMEGVIDSTIFSTYVDLFKDFENKEPKRKIGIMNLVPPLETCLARIQLRNGGKEIDEKAVGSKWRTVDRNADKFAEEGLISWKADNSDVTIENTLDWFLEEIKLHIV